MPSPSSSSPPASTTVVWAVYDLCLPGRAELLSADEEELKDLGVKVFAAGSKVTSMDEFLDGVAVEGEWMKQDRWRGSLQALRTELASAVDGEVFLRAARRAVWLAARAQSGAAPTMVFGAGLAESLVAWLVGKLLGLPFVATIDDDTRWEKKLVSQLRAEARSVRGSTITAALSSPA